MGQAAAHRVEITFTVAGWSLNGKTRNSGSKGIPAIMTTNLSSLGSCPGCGAPIGRQHVLIEYETDDGPDLFAECPGCHEVVHPV